MVKKLPARQEMWVRGFDPSVKKISWRRKWEPTPVFLPENPMDGGALRAGVHGVESVGHDLATKPPPAA